MIYSNKNTNFNWNELLESQQGKMELILNRIIKYHVSLDIVKEFEQSILSDSQVKTVNPTREIFYKSSVLIWKILDRYDFLMNHEMGSLFTTIKLNDHIVFSVLMGPDFRQCLPYFMTSARKNIYIFDAWPRQHEKIWRFARLFGVNNVFVSSCQAADLLQAKADRTKFHWIPEGIRPEEYKQYPYERKDIDVLALGRKYDAYHELIVEYLENNHKTYLYEKTKGMIIFPTRMEFIDGLARSRISICVPLSTTHPSISGEIETMTTRYLQSMIAKCLIVGKAPKELIALFGYNPVIEIDLNNPVHQLQSIFENFSNYIPLIENNFNVVIKHHTWRHRWEKIKSILVDEQSP